MDDHFAPNMLQTVKEETMEEKVEVSGFEDVKNSV
jgi:hypothetical protein